jgi:iron(III) transport system ATP-binding protein
MSIDIQHLSVAYGKERVINGLDLHIPTGSFFTLLGPSGCGKTTLLRTLAGFIPVAAGKLSFAGLEVTHTPAHQRNIGMVFQDYALFPNRSVFDNVAYGLRARQVTESSLAPQVNTALDRVGLLDFAARLPAALSGGQRQRVALARALVIKPQVLLMDEPLSNLDAKLRLQVRETLAELQRESGITTVFVTHDQEEALALSDQIAVMQGGQIAQLGSPSEIYQAPSTSYVADFIGAANLLTVACTASAAQTVQVSLAGHNLTAQTQGAITGQGILVLRPEALQFHASSGIPATVHSQQYLGGKTSYKVVLPSGERLQVERHGSRTPIANGSAVHLQCDPALTWVLAS